MAVRSDDASLQNSVGVHLRLKSAQECGFGSSAFISDLAKFFRGFIFGGMMISCGSFRVVFVGQRNVSKLRTYSPLHEEVLWAKLL